MNETVTDDELGLPPATARVYVCVGLKDWVGAAPHHAWTAQFEISEANTVDLRRQVESVMRRASSKEGLAPFSVREERGLTSWGADSGEVIRITLWMADHAVDGVLGAAIAALFKTLHSRSVQNANDARPISRQEALERAKWIIVSHYGLEARDSLTDIPTSEVDLSVVGEGHRRHDNSWTVTLRDNGGVTYRVLIGCIDGLVMTQETERILPIDMDDH